MKNIEKYEKEISHLVNEGIPLPCAIAIAAGISDGNCSGCKCSDCHKKCLEWMCSEYNEQILSDDEKEIVKEMCDVIHRFGGRVIYISKEDFPFNKYQIGICYRSDIHNLNQVFHTPLFMDDSFKGMKLYKKYSLEELGIELEKQNEEY